MSVLKNVVGKPEEKTDTASRTETLRSRLDWVLVIILAVTSLLASWSGYEATRWSGKKTTASNQAATIQGDANLEVTKGYLVASADMANLNSWVEAYAVNNQEMMSFFRRRLTPEFDVAFQAWLALDPRSNPDAPASPMDMEEYVNPHLVHAEALSDEADHYRYEANKANERADAHVLNTVIFASVLFFAGFASRIRDVRAQFTIEVLATLILLFGLYQIIMTPTA